MKERKIGLALSGGGVRAMAFHTGILRWLAETQLMEEIVHISSVSGGSLICGLIFKINNWRWPSSQEFLLEVVPEIKKILIGKDLQNFAIKRLLLPTNWRFLISRANVLSQTIERCWGISAKIVDLPEAPVWSVNGTTSETGRRFRFKKKMCGDYELGYAESEKFKVADVMAISAAIPVGIGPFVIVASDFVWKKRKTWDGTEEVERIKLPYERLHIYDGAIYDNLGIEPLFDVGTQKLKDGITSIIVSDAGAPLVRTSPSSPFNPFRAKRIAYIALDQTRALRVRCLINFIKNNSSAGKYLQIGADPKTRIFTYRANNEELASKLLQEKWLDTKEVKQAAYYSTDLRRMSSNMFEQIERHGYETAKWNHILFE